MSFNEIFLHIGYFITKPVEKPACIGIDSEVILTASDCFCNLVPNFYDILAKEQRSSKLQKLTKKQYNELRLISDKILKKREMLFNFSIFEYQDALIIKEKFFPDYGIFSLGISKENFDILNDEVYETYALKRGLPKVDGVFLGYDILGWEGGFHTYLCNGLEKNIRQKYVLKINEYGLIANTYAEVIEFAKLIEGEGEPVIWLPYAVFKN